MAMNDEIERQEKEFKELLQRMMKEPLNPIADSLEKIDGQIDQVCQAIDDIRKDHLVPIPILFFDVVEKIDGVERKLVRKTNDQIASLSDGLKQILESQEKNSAIRDQANVLQANTILESGLRQLSVQISAQINLVGETNQQIASLSKSLQEKLEGQERSATLREQAYALQANAVLENCLQKLSVQVSSLGGSLADLRSALTAQEVNIRDTGALQTELLGRLTGQMIETLAPLHKRLLAVVILAGAGLVATLAMAVRLLLL